MVLYSIIDKRFFEGLGNPFFYKDQHIYFSERQMLRDYNPNWGSLAYFINTGSDSFPDQINIHQKRMNNYLF